MKRKPYTVQEKEILLQSEAIEKVTNTSAKYLKEFKIFTVCEYMTGKTPLQIFVEAGLYINILPQRCLRRWSKIHKIYGVEDLLKDNRCCSHTGRARKNKLTLEEQLEKYKQENEILK